MTVWNSATLLAIGLLAGSFSLSLILGYLVQFTGIDDAPDGERKTQSRPIARLGGVAIAMSYVFCALLLSFIDSSVELLKAQTLGLALGFTFLSFLIGLWDDIWTANTKLKLGILSVACLACAGFGLIPNALTTPFGALNAPVLLLIGSALWLLVFTNSVNFMDGSNGLAIGSITIMLGGLALISQTQTETDALLWWIPLFGAIAGFLYFNMRGTLYAGDAGALGLGGLFASLALASNLNIWTTATLALPFLVDVLMTLIWRARQGRSWLEPHLDHAYQRLRVGGWTHLETAFLYWGFSVCAATAAYIAALAGGAAPFICFWSLGLVGIELWRRHRRAISVS